MSNFSVPSRTIKYDPAIIGSADLYIAETEVDAATAVNAGFPSIAFTNNLKSEENYITLIEICLKSEKIFLINTTGDTLRLSDIGFRLAKECFSVFVVNIYDEKTAQLKTLSDYLKTHKPEKLKTIIKNAPSFIDIVIAQLPENFPHASSAIKEKILPLVLKLDTATSRHYIDAISKRVKTSKKVIEEMLADMKRAQTVTDRVDAESTEEEEIDPEIIAAASALAQDPQLFKKRIDTINRTGVVNERTNISLFFVTLDSRLSKDFGKPGQRALALKSAGHFGAGKSFSLSMCLTIYPPNAYHLLTSGSEKSLYYLPDGLSHKCLIVAEGFQFTGEHGDNEISFIVRCLLSEGQVVRIVVEKDEAGKLITRRIVIPGPTSFITTTVMESLEPQLEDRMLSGHPSESSDQTKKIIESLAEQSESNTIQVSEREIQIWQTLHAMLEPVAVSIPFASRVVKHITTNMQNLPISMRRGVGKVLNVVRSIACLYQFQRQKDNNGNIVAEVADYAMAWQIIQDAFKENLEQISKTTNQRLQYIQSVGHVSLKDLATRDGISRSALSAWMKRVERDGDAHWVDNNGNDFPNDAAMKSAKRSAKAHIAVTGQWSQSIKVTLPSPSEITTNDPDWVPGGAKYELYHLHLVPEVSPIPVPAPPLTPPSPTTFKSKSVTFPPWKSAPKTTTPDNSKKSETDNKHQTEKELSSDDQAYLDGIKIIQESLLEKKQNSEKAEENYTEINENDYDSII